MKSINRAIERFCYNHPRFGIQRLMMYLVASSAAVFVIYLMDTTGSFLYYLSFSPDLILHGQIWRLVTWVLCPSSSSIIGTAFMLYFYYFIGSTLEREWGAAKFTFYYALGVVLDVIFGFAVWLISHKTIYLVPDYLNMSMFFAFAVLFPDQIVLFFFILPIKIKWLALLDVLYFAYYIFFGASSFAAALLPVVAILNFFIFCGDDLIGYIRRYIPRKQRPINFNKAARKFGGGSAGGDKSKSYRFKCAVCGRTDTEYPDLEFRYCSRCKGYHCFCIDHINNHIHFQ